MSELEEQKNNLETNWQEHEPIHYPPKPIPQAAQASLPRSLISLALFIGAFYLIFDWELQFILVLAGVVIIHEWGHFLAMKAFDYKELSIFFIPLLGAMASGTKDEVSQKQRVIILMAGPIPGLLIGLLLYYFGALRQDDLMLQSANIFIFLNLFNLLPIMPLDGGQLIKTLFFGSNEIINSVFIAISIILLGTFAVMSESFIFLIVPFFLGLQLYNQSQLRKVRKAVSEKGIVLNQTYYNLSDQDYWLIRDELGRLIKSFKRFIIPGQYKYSQGEGRVMKQIQSLVQKEPIQDLNLLSKIGIILIWLVALVGPVLASALIYLKIIDPII